MRSKTKIRIKCSLMVPLLFPRVWFGLCSSSAFPSHRRLPAAEWHGGGDGRPELGRRRLPPLHLGGEGTPRPHRLPHRVRPLRRRPPPGHPRRRLQRRIRRSLPYPFLHPQSRIPIDCLFFFVFFFYFSLLLYCGCWFFLVLYRMFLSMVVMVGRRGGICALIFKKKKTEKGRRWVFFAGVCVCVDCCFLYCRLVGDFVVAEPVCLLRGHDGPAYDVNFYGVEDETRLLLRY